MQFNILSQLSSIVKPFFLFFSKIFNNAAAFYVIFKYYSIKWKSKLKKRKIEIFFIFFKKTLANHKKVCYYM